MSATLLLTALAVTPAQSTILREATFTDVATATEVQTPGVVTTWTSPGDSVVAVANYTVLEGDNVTVTRISVSAEVNGELAWDVTALDPTGTRFSGSMESSLFSCGPDCNVWGITDFFSTQSPFGDPTSTANQGEQRAFVQFTEGSCGTSCQLQNSFTPSHPEWNSIATDSFLQTSAAAGSLFLGADDAAFNPTTFSLDRFELDLRAQSSVTVEYDLAQAPLTDYCASPAGSTGASVSLRAYGSQQEGSEALTIRADGLPTSSFALLFVGTAAANQPLGSYNLCVGGQIRREGGVQATGPAGLADFEIELEGQLAGETVYLQSIFRDAAVGIAATDGASFVVQPR
ncbi:MAG: hypothetical protein AAGG01_21580 [Planctomycetota bacterium]